MQPCASEKQRRQAAGQNSARGGLDVSGHAVLMVWLWCSAAEPRLAQIGKIANGQATAVPDALAWHCKNPKLEQSAPWFG
jgi:hypothetical protein